MTRPLLMAATLTLCVSCVPVTPPPGNVPGSVTTSPTPTTGIEPIPSASAVTFPSQAPTPSSTPTAVPSGQQSTVPVVSPSPTPSPTASPTPSASPTASPSASPTPKPPTIHTLTIQAQTSQTLSIPTTGILELEARIDKETVTGPSSCMNVFVNGQIIQQDVTNRSMRPQLANGQELELLNLGTYGWLAWFSPDFNAANTPTAGLFQVTSDPGQAYRYVWNVDAQKGSGTTMAVRIDNAGQGGQQLPLIVRIYQR